MKVDFWSVFKLMAIWSFIVLISFLLQIIFDKVEIGKLSIREQLNTFAYGVAIIMVIMFLHRHPKFPDLFDTRWFVFQLILGLFSYFVFEGIFIESIILPAENAMFTVKASSLGSSYIDKILGNGFGIYAITIGTFSGLNYKKEQIVGKKKSEFLTEIKIKLRERTYFISTDSISYIKSANNYCDIHTKNGVHVIRETISGLESDLDPLEFMRIHRSIIVRISCIQEFYSKESEVKVLLKNGEKLNVGNTYRKAFMARFDI